MLWDAATNLSGVAVANRAGRQAILAKVIVDATDRAWVARMAGAATMPFPNGSTQTFQRVVIGGAPQSGAPIASVVTRPFTVEEYAVHEYELGLTMADGSFASYAAAEQAARDATFSSGLVDASAKLFQVPPDPIVARVS